MKKEYLSFISSALNYFGIFSFKDLDTLRDILYDDIFETNIVEVSLELFRKLDDNDIRKCFEYNFLQLLISKEDILDKKVIRKILKYKPLIRVKTSDVELPFYLKTNSYIVSPDKCKYRNIYFEEFDFKDANLYGCTIFGFELDKNVCKALCSIEDGCSFETDVKEFVKEFNFFDRHLTFSLSEKKCTKSYFMRLTGNIPANYIEEI